MATPSSTQVGAIAENLIANALMIESNGRLAPFLPLADDDGIDLLIYDKESGKALPVQIKSRTVTLKKRGSEERGNTVHFEVRHAAFKVERFGALIGVLTADRGYGIDCAWVIPMEAVPKVALCSSTKYVLRPSRSAKSHDQCIRYRCADLGELHHKVMEMLARAP